MKIIGMRVHSIAMADPPLRSSYGLHAPYALRTVLELESDDGVTGIAETYGGDGPAQALRQIREQVVGTDPYRLTGSLLSLVEGEGGGLERSQTHLVPGENPLDASARTYSAIETACLDLIGKTTGQPVCDLIGGRVRDEVPFSVYPFYKHAGGGGEGDDAREDKYGEALTPESLVAQARQMIDEYGFGSVKFKGGVLDPEIEIETVRRMRREFGPDVPIRIDPNSAWTVETSIHVGKELAEELSGGGYLRPRRRYRRHGRGPQRLAGGGCRDAAGQQRRGHLLRPHPARGAARRGAGDSLRPPLLGRYAAGAASG